MKLEITNHASEADNEFVATKTREYNTAFVPNEYENLSIFHRSSDGEILGGLTGKTFWDWLHIEYLWVNETERNQKIGSQIILAAEKEAKARGCVGSTLDTFSFQALGFYEKLGYTIAGRLPGYLGAHERYYLQKKLD